MAARIRKALRNLRRRLCCKRENTQLRNAKAQTENDLTSDIKIQIGLSQSQKQCEKVVMQSVIEYFDQKLDIDSTIDVRKSSKIYWPLIKSEELILIKGNVYPLQSKSLPDLDRKIKIGLSLNVLGKRKMHEQMLKTWPDSTCIKKQLQGPEDQESLSQSLSFYSAGSQINEAAESSASSIKEEEEEDVQSASSSTQQDLDDESYSKWLAIIYIFEIYTIIHLSK